MVILISISKTAAFSWWSPQFLLTCQILIGGELFSIGSLILSYD